MTEAQVLNGTKNEGQMDHDSIKTIRPRLYPEGYKGPFTVYLRQIDDPIKFLAISKTIVKSFGENVIAKMHEVNRSKARIEFISAKYANDFVSQPLLSEYRKYILSENVEVSGVIDVPHFSDVQEMASKGSGKFKNSGLENVKIIEVYPFKKIISEENGQKKSLYTGRTKIVFEGTVLPNWVELEQWLIPVRVFNPSVMTCDKCGKFNHTSTYCKTKCVKCNTVHTNNVCAMQDTSCIYCSKVHEHLWQCSQFSVLKQKAAQKNKKKIKTSYAKAIANSNKFSPLIEVSGVDVESNIVPNINVNNKNPFEFHAPTTQVTNKLSRRRQRSPADVTPPATPVKRKNKLKSDVQSETINNSTFVNPHKSVPISPGFRFEKPAESAQSTLASIIEQVCDTLGLAQHWKQLAVIIIVPLLENLCPQLIPVLSTLGPLFLSKN